MQEERQDPNLQKKFIILTWVHQTRLLKNVLKFYFLFLNMAVFFPIALFFIESHSNTWKLPQY